MRQKLFSLFLSAVFSLVCLPAILAAETPKNFSADMIMQGQGLNFQGRIFVSDKKTRMEMPEATMIMRLDKNVSWMLMPSQKMYMEQPIDLTKVAQATGNVPGLIEKQSLG